MLVPLWPQCLILSTYLIMSVADGNDGPPLGRRQPAESWEGHSGRAGDLGGLWRAGALGVWAMHRPTLMGTTTHEDAFGMAFCILFRRFFSCCHLCPFSDFSLFSLAYTDNSAFLCLHLWCDLCVWGVRHHLWMLPHLTLWTSSLMQTGRASSSLLNSNGSQNLKKTSGRHKGP